MHGLARWCGISLVIHLVLGCGLACLATSTAKQAQPIIIDFTIEAPNHATACQTAVPAPALVAARKSVIRSGSVVREKIAADFRPEPVPAPDTPKSPMPVKETASAAASAGPPESTAATAVGHPSPDGTATGKEGGKGHTAGPATGEHGTENQGKAVYLREHFSYIRGIVMRRLIYPDHARRMGWSGKVVLCFTVAEDGTVNDVKVLQGSGVTILDRGAVDAVKRAAPFPRPPVRAEVMLPITYRLL